MRTSRIGIVLLAAVVLGACGSGEGKGDPVRFTVPRGSGMSAVADTLAARSVINLQHADTGLETSRVLAATVDLNWSRY